MYSYVFVAARTGEKLLTVKAESSRWARSLNVGEGGTHTFKLADLRIPREQMWALTTPWDRVLVVCWNDIPVYAGMITGRPYNRGTQVLTVNHTDVRSIFLARYPFGVKSYWADVAETIPGRLVLSGLSLRAIAANVVQQGLLGPLTNYGLPIVLPSLTEPGPHSLTIENFNFRKVADVLDDIQSMDGGPDIEFAPRWSASDRLEWVMRTGTPTAPELTGGTFRFNLTSESPGLSTFILEEDAQKQVTGVFATGEGFGADIKVGGTPGAAIADIPARDEVVSFPTAKTAADAASFAREYLSAHRKATLQPSMTVSASKIEPTSLILGSTLNIYDRGDWWNADGWSSYRLIGFSVNDSGDDIALTVQGAR